MVPFTYSAPALPLAILAVLCWPLSRYPLGKFVVWTVTGSIVILDLMLVGGTISQGGEVLRTWGLYPFESFLWIAFWVLWQLFIFLLFLSCFRLRLACRETLGKL